MEKVVSMPVCVVCGRKFHTNSYVWESKNELCYCSIECILKSKGFNRIKWDSKYRTL